MEKNLTKTGEKFFRELQDFLESARAFNSKEDYPFYLDFDIRPKNVLSVLKTEDLNVLINDFPKD